MKNSIIKTFANLKLAIVILLLIASASIIGTVIEQNQNTDYYTSIYTNTIPNTKISLSEIILKLELNHVYSTNWYLSLLVLFGICLISCTILQQIPLLRRSKDYQFQLKIQEFKKQKYTTKLKNQEFKGIIQRLKKNQFSVFQQKNAIYGYQGLIGRFAPILVHFSMILILIGTSIAALTSFNSQELESKGEIFQLKNIVNQGVLSQIKRVPFRINDFWVEYGSEQKIKQFYTDVSILNERGNELKQKTISVNYPLRYKNLTIYQTDWEIIGLRFQNNQKTYQIPLTSLNNKKTFWVGWFPITKEKELTFLVNNLNGQTTIYLNQNLLEQTNINNTLSNLPNFKIQEILIESGLQIKTDLGVPLIYFGFGLLLFSSLASYISYTQLWFLVRKQKIFMGGKANRALLNLKLEFSKLQ